MLKDPPPSGTHSPEFSLLQLFRPSLPQALGCLPCLHTLPPLGPFRVLFSPRYSCS